MADKTIDFGDDYKKWIYEVSCLFKASQIKASIKVNDEMLRFYWILGRDIETMKRKLIEIKSRPKPGRKLIKK